MKGTLKFLTLFAFVMLLGTAFTPAETNIAKWVKLGSKKVAYGLDKDIIHVGGNKGVFTKLKIEVKKGNLNMHKMVIEYGNGSKENISLKKNFTRGDNTRLIDLKGNKRVIKDITFWYDTKNTSSRKAVVHVFGRR